MNKNDLLEEKFLICKFSFNIPLKSKVRVKEILEKHNKEIKWKIEEIETRDENGDKTIDFRLINEKETLENLNDKIDLISGFLIDLYNTLGWSMTEEQANSFNSGFIGIHKGEVIKKLEIGNINIKEIYFFRHLFGELLNIIGEANKLLEAEKEFPKVTEKIFGVNFEEWYKENVQKLKKMIINKSDYENSKAIVERFEETKIKKIPYKKDKFRFKLSD